MRAADIVSTKALKISHSEVASNKIPYLGEGLFPAIKKMGIDLKQIRTAKGLPVSLNPSAYDTVSAIRSRKGFKVDETEMAYFKESMLVKERDKIELLRVQDANDPYALEAYKSIFNDAETLIESADVVAERMRMQLLASDGGHPSISLAGDGATYTYNYDPNGEYATNNYRALTGTSKWTDTDNSDPIADVKKAKKAISRKYGANADVLIINDTTMDLLVANKKVRSYILAQNVTGTVNVDEDAVIDVFKRVAKVTIVDYDKAFTAEDGNAKTFYPNCFATLVPNGSVGNTYYGTTPEEIEMLNGAEVDTQIFDNKITVTVTHTTDPAQTKTTVSETLLPSFERMFETYTLKVCEATDLQ